jgi:hypothetical protein
MGAAARRPKSHGGRSRGSLGEKSKEEAKIFTEGRLGQIHSEAVQAEVDEEAVGRMQMQSTLIFLFGRLNCADTATSARHDIATYPS